MKTPYIRRTRLLDLRPDVWLFEKYIKGRFQIFANGSRCGRSILGPPHNDALDLGGGAPRDMKLKGHC